MEFAQMCRVLGWTFTVCAAATDYCFNPSFFCFCFHDNTRTTLHSA